MGALIRLLLWSFALWALPSAAHELSMAELQVRELSRGEFVVFWGAGEKSMPSDSLTPVWPAHCVAEQTALHCGEQGLTGVVSVKGVGERFSAVLIKVFWACRPVPASSSPRRCACSTHGHAQRWRTTPRHGCS